MIKIIHNIFDIFTNIFNLIFPKTAKQRRLEKITIDEWWKISQSGVYENVYYYFPYENSDVRDAIWEIKYRRNKKLGEALAKIVCETLVEEISEKVLFENFTNPLLTWIPQSKNKKSERGFNQSKDLAEIFKIYLGGTAEELLEKKSETESQTKLGRAKRLENMKGVFLIPKTKSVEGKNIILVDDVVTTGATLNEARKVLLKAGARKVLCIAMAH